MDQLDIRQMKRLCEFTALAWCVTGLHFGVTLPHIKTCPYCKRTR